MHIKKKGRNDINDDNFALVLVEIKKLNNFLLDVFVRRRV